MYSQEKQNTKPRQNIFEHDYGINTSMDVCESEVKQEPFEEEFIDNASVEIEPHFEHANEFTSVVSTTTQLELNYTPPRASVKKSIVWNFFQTEADKKTVVCNTCHKRLKFCGNTTNFKEHLKRLHPDLLAKTEQHIQQQEDQPAEEPQQNTVSSIHCEELPGPSTLKLSVCNNKSEQVGLTESKEGKIHEMVDALSSSSGQPPNRCIKIRSVNMKTKSKLGLVPKIVSKKSIVWKYFKMIPGKKILICTICKKHFRSFRNTSNLKEHLKRVHSNYSSTRFQQNDRKHQRLQSPEENPIQHKNQLNKALVRMIVADYQPLSMTESLGFKSFVTMLNPTYKLPSEEALEHELIPKYFDEIHSQLVEELKNADSISLTIDTWQSKYKNKFVSIYGHYVQNYEMCSKNLATRNITQQTTEDIFDTIGEVLKEYQIYDKSLVIVLSTDNTIKELLKHKLKKGYIQCTAYKLGSIVNDALIECANVKNIIAMYVAHLCDLQRNIELCNKLREKQQEMGLPDLKLKYLTNNKWHFMYILLERFLAVRQPLRAALNDLSLLPNFGDLLQSSSVDIIEDIVSVLKPMFQIIEELSTEKYVPVSNIIPLFKCLEHRITNLNLNTDAGNKFKESILSSLLFSIHSFEFNKVMAKATFLDPRFKKPAFSSEFPASNAEQWVVEELHDLIDKQKQEKIDLTKTVSGNDNNEIPCMRITSKLTDDLWAHFDNKVVQHNLSPTKHSTSWASLAVRKYAEMALLPRKGKPLKFWEEHSTLFPELAKLAEKYLSVPTTSAPSEMLFSKKGVILRDRQSMVDPDIVNQIVFLNANM